jgi:anion-transporting  ArsA/GET3 family ATPase
MSRRSGSGTGRGSAVIDWKPSVLLCLGPGGVGKTTMAAAAGVAAAVAGERVVVLTIDPAHRLADILGLERRAGHGLGGGGALGNEPRLVEGPWPGELWAAMLDPAVTLNDLIRRHGGAEQAERVLGNRLFTTISESLSGMNEYMAAEKLYELHHDERFDRVVVDTPPSRHAVDFLDSPGRLTRFVDNRFYRAVLAQRSGIARPVNLAAKRVVRLTARVVGADLVDDVIRLFADLEGLDEGFRQRAVETTALLAGDDCTYALVTTARREPIREAQWILDSVRNRGTAIDCLIVNRMTPASLDDEPITGGRRADRDLLAVNAEQLQQLADEEAELVTKLAGTSAAVPAVLIEERNEPLTSLDDLVGISAALREPE